jgi:hypothetical protein
MYDLEYDQQSIASKIQAGEHGQKTTTIFNSPPGQQQLVKGSIDNWTA